MDLLAETRALALDQEFDALGTPMTATPPGQPSVETHVIWDEAELEDAGRSRQLRRAFWVSADDLAEVPRGTQFVGPEPHGGADQTWRADQTLAVLPGKIQVLVTKVQT